MRLTLDEIRRKEVVNIVDGSCFGFPDDIVIDTETKEVTALVMKEKSGFLGIFETGSEVLVPWERIDTIGKDTILVKTEQKSTLKRENSNIIRRFLNKLLDLIAK